MKTSFLVACPAPVLALADKKFRETGRLQKKCRTIMFRKNLEDLKDAIAKSFEIYPVLDPEMGTGGWREKEKYWSFTSGATVEMRHLDGPTDHEAYNGNEFVVLLFDEVQFISYQAYSFLLAQVRSSDPDYRKHLMVRCTANPGGPYGDWVKRHFFVDTCPEGGKIFEVKTKLADGREVSTTRTFIRSYLKDNPHLDPDGSYEARLRATMSADEVKMYLDGDFDCVSGAFFSSLLKPNVHFVKSKPIPSNWEMMFSIDWGSTEPACCLVAARDNDNRVWIIDEEHGPGVTGSHFGKRLATLWKHQKWCKDGRKFKTDEFWGVIDKQAMDRYGSESTAAAGIQESGFRIFAADKLPGERKVGINGIKERLLLDKDNQPQLIVFEDRCPNLVRALKAINSQAPIDPEDYADRSPLSHACFVAGTMVRTPTGEVPIETLKVGDLVETDVGPRAVEAASRTDVDVDVVRVEFDDGTHLTGTGNHPVFLADGMTQQRLDALHESQEVSAWHSGNEGQGQRASGSKALSTFVTPTLPSAARGSITTQPRDLAAACIGRSGSSIMARSRRVIMSTISMVTQATTGSRISSAWMAESTSLITCASIPARTSPLRPGLPLLSGMVAPRVGHGMPKIQKTIGESESRTKQRVGIVRRIISLISLARGFARRLAGMLMGSRWEPIRSPRTVAGVAGRSSRPSTPGPSSAKAVRCTRPGPRADVFNLTVAERHRYYANGTLVSNCDALRFMIMKWPVRTVKEENKTDIEVARWNRILRKAKADTEDEERIGTGYGD